MASISRTALCSYKEVIHSSALEGLGDLQKINEEKRIWPSRVGIRPKAWRNWKEWEKACGD